MVVLITIVLSYFSLVLGELVPKRMALADPERVSKTVAGPLRVFQKIASQGCAVVMSTHNTALIENYPARAVLFSKGKIREVDLKAELA